MNLLCAKDLISMENVEINILRKSWVRKIVLPKGDFIKNTKCFFIFPIKSFLRKQSYFQRLKYWLKNFISFFLKWQIWPPDGCNLAQGITRVGVHILSLQALYKLRWGGGRRSRREKIHSISNSIVKWLTFSYDLSRDREKVVATSIG